MVGQQKSLDFENILNTGKILLVKLSQGLMGDENSYLLGTVFVSKIYQAAMARQAQGKADRKDFFLYVDEFPAPGKPFFLDLNRAYNPPCAFSQFTTCPLPPRQNILKVRIEAGEKYPPRKLG